MKLITVALVTGCALLFGPWYLFSQPGVSAIVSSLVGFVLIAIVGYNAQASLVGMGEPGEELLQQAWHWFRVKVLRQDVPPLSALEPVNAHQSIAPMPPLSPLSKGVQGIGLVLVIAPTLLGWKVGNDWRMVFIAVGGVLIVLARLKLPPKHPDDPPHGQELLQVVWSKVRGLFKGQP